MKLIFVIIILLVTAMCCCYSFTLITTTVAVGSSAPIGQSQINAWLLGTPQPGPYGEPVSNGEIRLAMTAPYGAYFSDDTSFLCIDPILGVDTYITDCYHTFRGAGKWAHTGIDYGTSYSDGHPLVSVMGGQVVFMGIMSNSDGSPGWGQTIVIENNGYLGWHKAFLLRPLLFALV